MKIVLSLISGFLFLSFNTFTRFGYLGPYKPLTQWSRPLLPGFEGTSVAKAALESLGGRVVAAGYAERGTTKKDMVLGFYSAETGDLLGSPIFIGGPEDDVCNALALTLDGGFVGVGYTETKYYKQAGGKNAWIVRLDESGDTLWTAMPAAAPKDDELTAVTALQDSTFVAVGTLDEKPYLVHFGMNGAMLHRDTFEDIKNTEVLSVAINQQGEVALSGKTGRGFGERSFVLWLNRDFSVKHLLRDNGKNPQKGSALCYDPRQKAFILATSGQQNLAFYKIEETNTLPQPMAEIKRDQENHIASILPLRSGGSLGIGHTKSGEGLTYFRPLLLEQPQSNSRQIRLEEILQQKQNIYVYHATWQHTGSLLLAMGKINEKEAEEGWICRMKPSVVRIDTTAPVLALKLEQHLCDHNRPDTLEGLERAYLPFTIENKGPKPAFGLKAIVTAKRVDIGLGYFDTIPIGTLWPGERRLYSIPFFGRYNISDGLIPLTVQILGEKGAASDSFSYLLHTHRMPLPKLEIQHIEYTPLRGDTILNREQVVTLRAMVKNTGDTTAHQVRLDANFPYLVQKLPDSMGFSSSVPQLHKGDSCLLECRFLVRWVYQNDRVRVSLNVYENVGKYPAQAYAIDYVRTANYLEASTPEGRYYIPPRRKGPYSPMPPLSGIRWEFVEDSTKNSKCPEQQEGLGSLREPFRLQRLRLKAVLYGIRADFKKTDVNITYKNNENPKKLDTTQYDIQTLGNGRYRVVFTVQFEEGNNLIAIKSSWGNCPSFNVYYKPPRLHLFCIGINGGDFTSARSNTKAVNDYFLKQKGTKLYRDVVSTLCIEEKQTIKKELISMLVSNIHDRILGDPENPKHKDNLIYPEDIFILYISSHAERKKEKLYLLTRDENGATAWLDLQEQIIKTVTHESFSKIFMVMDVCQSGQLTSQIPKEDNRSKYPWRADSTQFALLTSCTAEEKSYGEPLDSCNLFTRAFLDALDNKEQPVAATDGRISFTNPQKMKCSPDSDITTKEIYHFVRRRFVFLWHQMKQEHEEKKKRFPSSLPQTVSQSYCDDTPIYIKK